MNDIAALNNIETCNKTMALRKRIENVLFKNKFIKDPFAFVEKFLNNSDFLFCVYESTFFKSGVPFLYNKSDFNITFYRFEGEIIVLRADLPKPELVGICYRIYFIIDNKKMSLGYYTIVETGTGIELVRHRSSQISKLTLIPESLQLGNNFGLLLAWEAIFILDDFFN